MDLHSELWMLWATVAVALIISLSILKPADPSATRRPPGPRPLPLIGNLLDLRGNLHHTLARLARVHGPVMRVKMGLTTAVVISSRDAAREAFTRHDRRLAARAVPDIARAQGLSERSMIWLPSSDPRWKTLRGVVASHLLTPRNLAAARGVRERKVRELARYLRARAGEVVDVGQVVYGGVLNLVSCATCSVDVVEIGAESATGLRKLVEDLVELIATPNVSDLFPFLRPLDLQGWRRLAGKHMEKIYGILDGIVERRCDEIRRSSSKDPKNDFLGELLELMSTGKMSRDNVTGVLFDVLAAGSDTIAITVEWAMAELLRNPGVMSKLRAEIEGVLGGKEAAIEEPDAAGLAYLQAVVKEAMRLHPVAPLMLPHLAVEDGVEVGGYAVPRGSTVMFNTWAIMRDPAAWERPDEFAPERFLDAAAEVEFRGKDFEFIPFGSGRRMCPGLPMAERVVPFVVASLLHAFEWRLPDGVSPEQLEVREKFTTSNVMAVPLKAVPIPIIRT